MNEQTSVAVSPVAALEARVAEQEKRISELQAALAASEARKAAEKTSTGPVWNGMAQTALQSALGYAGWTPAEVATLLGRGFGVYAVNLSNVGWGAQWRKGVLRGEVIEGQTKYKSYGPRPKVLSAEQLEELAGLRDGVKGEVLAVSIDAFYEAA